MCIRDRLRIAWRPAVVCDVCTLERGPLTADTVGLRLAEANDLLAAVQQTLVAEQARATVAAQARCPHCGTPHRRKDSCDIVMRTLFGALRLPSPRWRHCPCRPQPTRTFSPLAAALPDRSTPELVYLQAKFGGLISYRLSARLLCERLPLGRTLHATTVRRQVEQPTRATGEIRERPGRELPERRHWIVA